MCIILLALEKGVNVDVLANVHHPKCVKPSTCLVMHNSTSSVLEKVLL